MDTYADYLSALDSISGVLEVCLSSEARIQALEALSIARDLARRLEEQFQEARIRRDFYETIISSIADGVIVADAEQHITILNDAAGRLLGQSADEGLLLGEIDVRMPDGLPIPIDDMPLSRGLRGEKFTDYEIILVRPDGVKAHLKTSGAPVRGASGEIRGAVVVMHDLTREYAMLEQLEHERQKLEQISEQLKQSYEREHHIAGILQSSLLPVSDIEVEGFQIAAMYRPAMETERIGGDFYDLFKLPDGRVAICIGDVSGKGVEAAVFTSLTRDCIRAFILETPQVSQVLTRLNNTLLAYLPPDYFVTLFLAALFPETGQLTYACAGHDPPLTYRCHPTTVEELPVTGRLSGIFPNLTYEEKSTSLNSGDALFLYTDGLADARREGQIFGTEGLADVLLASIDQDSAVTIEHIYQAALQFAGGSLHDDAAAVLVKAL